MLSADGRAARHRRSPPRKEERNRIYSRFSCVSLPNPRSRSKNGRLLKQLICIFPAPVLCDLGTRLLDGFLER